MPISQAYLDQVRDRLANFGSVAIRRMFGGAGVYLDGLFVALVEDDRLYLKADDGNRPTFEVLGLAPFVHRRKDGRTAVMGFYPPPAGALEDAAALAPWVEGALAAARRAKGQDG